MNRFARTWLSRALVAALGLAGAPAFADDDALGFERTPPRLSFTDGAVSYWRPGSSDWTDARVNTALAAGDELSTGSGANLELQVGARAWLRAGEATQLGITSLEPDFLQLKLTTGTAALDLRELPAGNTLEIDTPNAAFTIERAGFYRVEIASDATTFITRRGGRATVSTTGGLPTAIEANEQLVVSGADAPALSSEAAPDLDDWDRWNYSRSGQQLNPQSARYVPAGVYGAGDLDEYGSWQRVPSYGAVWVPRVVVGWTPYSTGFWVADPYYGWTWVDDAPWGWAPFHYGRWVYVRGYWAWAPGPRVAHAYYAPALVAFYGSSHLPIGVRFGGAPHAGWVALGWGEPVVPWWGPRGCRGQVRWAGWGGPHYVNNVEINHHTTVNVNDIHRYAHADRDGAFVAVDRNRFGHGDVREARVSRFDRSRMQPVGGRDLGVPSDGSTRVSAERRREAPAPELRERRVVSRRDTLEPGVRDPTRAPTREARGSRSRARAESETRVQRARLVRAERSSPPPARTERADSSTHRRSVSERAPDSRRDRGEHGVERGPTAPSPDEWSRAPRHRARDAGEDPQGSSHHGKNPRAENRSGDSPRGGGRERPAERERPSEAAPQRSAPAPSGGGQRPASDSGDGGRRRGDDRRSRQHGQD